VRVFCSALIVCGLLISGVGVYTWWTSQQSEQQAEAQWEGQITQRPAAPAARAHRGEKLARLSIDRLDSHWVVVEGAETEELRRAPGHLIDTALPGSRGNCVIAGHRDTQFRVLRNVKIGEDITVESGGRTFVYRVTDTNVVAPTDTRSLSATPTATLTLVTCYPFYYVGPAPKRFVIRAKLLPTPKASQS
jgi:sortase A